MKAKTKNPEPLIDDKNYIDYVSEEITNFLIETNLELYNAEKNEKYEFCSEVKEILMVFINDTSRVLSKETNVSMQKLYSHFHNQNDYIHQMIREQYKDK
jgi:hypothetical protein